MTMTNTRTWLRWTIAAVGVLAAVAETVPAALAQDLPPGAKRMRVSFADHLFVEDDVMLRGTHAEARVTFTRPASWRILPGSKLHVFYTHSGTLLPEQSSLTVRIAESSRSVRLDKGGSDLREVELPIEPSRLGPYNAIQFVGGMHYTLECEDPFHPTLWTSISRDSYIDFIYIEEDAFTDLAVFPYPYFDPLAYPPVELTYVMPRDPSSATLTALARVSGAIAQDAAYRPVDVRFVDEIPAAPRGNYIVVGTAAEQPEAMRLLREAQISPPANASAGIVASMRLAQDRRYAALVVSGQSGEAVLRAASSLVDRSSRSSFIGSSAVVERYESGAAAIPRDWQGFVPDRTRFSFQELGFEGQTVRGVFSAPVRLEVKVQPDARPVEHRQKLHIHYAYGASLKRELSTMEVVLNGISLRSVPLTNKSGSESEWLTVDVPWDLYGPYNRLELLFHLYPDTFRECERVSDRQLWGSVYPDSYFEMPRDYWVEYPDLSTFARWGFPFTLRADLSETVVVLPGPGARDAVHTLVRLMNFLMKPHVRDTVRVRAVHAADINAAELAKAHVIFLAPHANPAAEPLLSRAALVYSPDGRVAHHGASGADLETRLYREGAVLEAQVSPWSDQHAVLLVHESEDGLLGTLYGPNSAKVLAQIRGAAAVVAIDGQVNTVGAHHTQIFGEIPFPRRVRYLMSQYWGALLGIGILAMLFLFAAIRIILNRHRARIAARDNGG